MFSRKLTSVVPRQARSISLLDSVKRVLSRTPSTPTPPTSEDTAATTGQSITSNPVPADQASPLEQVGKVKKQNKVIGFDISAPPRLSGPELMKALDSVFAQPELKDEAATITHAGRLQLARAIMQQTGHRVPDVILNAARNKQDLVRFLQKEDTRGKPSFEPLTFDQVKFPDNVKVDI